MTKKALLITGQESETVSTLARNLIHVGGLSIFARQMKQMKAIGVDEMHVVTDWFTTDFEKEILNCTERPERIFIHTTKEAPLRLLEHNNEGNIWFLIEEAVVIDDRIIAQIAKHPSPSVISFIGHNEFLSSRTAGGMLLQLEDQDGYFGAIAKLSSGTLAANVRKLNTLEGLPGALKAISRASDCMIAKITHIPLYIPGHRRDVDLVWFPVIRREDGNRATDALLEFTEKETLDWPAKYIHRPIENLMVRYICKCPVVPYQITVVTGILGFYIMYLFSSGHMLPALFGAYIVGIMAGVGGKLACVSMQTPTIYKLEHLLDRLVEYGWYFAIAAFLSTPHGEAPYIMATALILFRLADEIQSNFFRRLTGFHIYDTAPFDRKLRLVGGGRNTQMWALLPFALYGQWYAGFGFICLYGIVTFFIHQLRLVYHLKNMVIANNEIFTENFKKNQKL
ncbi:MAG: hypothetical protein COB49_03350 [Alphaproteobacteria bacterium]|nr:MAG: hypothetical protein COB49_03350 [Alphaproteobacteria bacterium]